MFNYQRGLETLDSDFKSHVSHFGTNKVSRKTRWPCKFSVMPFFYIFLVCVTAGVTCADYYLYEYDFWYIQGSAMALIVLITMLVFGFGRVRMGKIEA